MHDELNKRTAPGKKCNTYSSARLSRRCSVADSPKQGRYNKGNFAVPQNKFGKDFHLTINCGAGPNCMIHDTGVAGGADVRLVDHPWWTELRQIYEV